MKVLVCGGRDFKDKKLLTNTLNTLHVIHGFTALVHGNAKGADALADEWAYNNQVVTIYYSADWDKYGKSAGPIRNLEMLIEEKPELVVAFPGGKGTAHLISEARKRNIKVLEIYED